MRLGPSASLFEAARQQVMAGRVPEADHLLRQALALDPHNVDCIYLLGVIAELSGQAEASLALFEHALALKPDFAPAHAVGAAPCRPSAAR